MLMVLRFSNLVTILISRLVMAPTLEVLPTAITDEALCEAKA